MADNISIRDASGTTVVLGAKDLSSVFLTKHVQVDDAGNITPAGDAAARASHVIVGNGTITLGVVAEDAAHSSGHTGIMPLGVRNDTHTTAFSGTDGDYTPLGLDSSGKLGIRGTFAEDSASSSADLGLQVLAVRQATATDLSAGNTDGDYEPLQVDASGRLWVNAGALTPGTAAGNLGKAEDAAHSSGDTGVMLLAVREAAATDLSAGNTDGDYEPLQVDASGRLWCIPAANGPVTAGTAALKSDLIAGQFLAYGSLPGATTGQQAALQMDATGTLKTGTVPLGTPLVDSHTGAATATTCTLAKSAAKMSYLSGIAITGLGATSAGSIQVTTTGLIAELTFTIYIPAGATLGITPLIVTFDPPLQASAVNTDIVVTVPSFGSGNTVASASAWGFKI